ncbi:MAG: hypothetical protein JXR03_08395 [Cyclobacteriaceae bacterium]
MKNRLILLCLLLLIGASSYAQFANNWIDPNQRYFRIPVIEDGLHTISPAQLSSAGIPLSTPPNRFQIFRKGRELAINVVSQNNLVSSIEFYGRRNDGTSDEELYRTPETQPHQLYNLFTDTAAYFLTWKLTNDDGRRMQTDASLTPATAESFHLEEIRIIESSTYSFGDKYRIQKDISSALYDEGEGFTGASKGKNGIFTYTLNISNWNETTPEKPKLELFVQGRNNQNHRSVLYIGPSGTQLRVLDTLENFSGFENYLYEGSLEWSDFSAGQCVIQMKVLGFDGLAENQSISYLRLSYPQFFDLQSNENKLFTLNPSSEDRLYVRVPTSNSATRIIDITDEYNPIIRQTDTSVETGAIFFSINDSPSLAKEVLAVTSTIEIVDMKESIFEPIDPQGSDYLIISNRRLMTPASDGIDPVQAYVEYREEKFDVTLAEINDIYDQFNYGDPSPIAIKNYLKYAISVSDIDFLFIIGKGLLVETFEYYRNSFYSSGVQKPHFVPTYGVPGSDVLFSVGLTDPFKPAVPTGRLSAQSSEDVKSHLDKIKLMESLPFDQLWRKNFIQLSGGQTLAELNLFSTYIEGFERIAEDDFFGGMAFNRGKSSVEPVSTISIFDQLNAGVNIVTFFGHSTSATADISIGSVSNPSLNNLGKYPLLFVNGCNGGAIFRGQPSFGEEWMLNENEKGAIGVIAHSDLALSNNLRRFTNLFYETAYGVDETFGLEIGKIMEICQSAYFDRYGVSDEPLSQVYGMLLQGDPAYKLFGASAPDYAISSEEVQASAIESDRIVSTSPSFLLDLIVSNFGRTVTDSLTIKVDRTLSDGSIISYEDQFLRPLYKDTIAFEIQNDENRKNDGQNVFLITLDPYDSTSELNEANNIAMLELFLPKGNTINLYPIEYAAIASSEVEFLWHAEDILSESRVYSFELDTSATFKSSYLKSDQLTGQSLLSKKVNLGDLSDSTTLYWRTRFAEPREGEDTTWVTSSFTLLPASLGSWGQFSNDQILENEIVGALYDEQQRKWEFQTSTLPVQIATHGLQNANGYDSTNLKVIVNGINLLLDNSKEDPFCALNTFNAVVFDKETAAPTRPLGFTGDDLLNPLVCGLQPQVINNFTRDHILGDRRYLDSLIKVMDVGSAILLFSFQSVTYSEWDDRLKSSLNQIGIQTSTINSLVDGQPVIFLGKKGIAEGEAIELVDNGGGLPVEQQSLELTEEVIGIFSSAQVKTNKIGPARSWSKLTFSSDSDAEEDEVEISIRGLDSNNNEDLIFNDVLRGEVDLSSIDAQQYPYINLEYRVSDDGDQKPSMLTNWLVDYELPPEGLLLAKDVSSVEIQEGAPFSKSFDFWNISNIDFNDSIDVGLSFLNTSNADLTTKSMRIPGPMASDTVSFEVEFSSLNKVGKNNLAISVSPNEPELYSSNNSLNLVQVATVKEDNTNPVLDVTFDGIHILDGDIVSPSPRVVVKFRDDNQYLFKQDTTGITIALKSPCEGCDYERINMSSSQINYTPASNESDFEIEYLPVSLEDGVYNLRVQGQDESGNESGLQAFEVSFEVITESSITHFYPYPNPFSTSTRFVFTLTGSEIPEEIKIQIMTISGRVVREITQDEIGPLKIGNNISEYAWDGKDEYGDRLANGVYLYKVFVRQNGDRLKHRTTTADRAFKNGFGKIYLLR